MYDTEQLYFCRHTAIMCFCGSKQQRLLPHMALTISCNKQTTFLLRENILQLEVAQGRAVPKAILVLKSGNILTLRRLMSYIYIYIYIYIYDISSLKVNNLTLILLTWRKW